MMTSKTDRPNDEPTPSLALPELPAFITLEDRKQYEVAGDVWRFPAGGGIELTMTFNWTLLASIVVADTSTPVMSARAITLVKLYVLERLDAGREQIKPRSAKKTLRAMLVFAGHLAAHPTWMLAGRGFEWSDMSADLFDDWLILEYRNKRKGDLAALVRRFYLWGAEPDRCLPDFSADLAAELNNIYIKRSAEGELVESRDAKRGPFTHEEMEMIRDACETGAGNDQDRAIVWTFLDTAMRPIQIFKLTNQDLEVVEGVSVENDADGAPTEVSYRLRVFKVKQRRNVIKYHYLPLSKGCGKLLYELRKPGSDADAPLLWWITSEYLMSIGNRLRAFSEAADLRSPRLPIEHPEDGDPTHERLPLTPRRFRYAVATDRINYGHTPEDVADMLGHKGTRRVNVYVETSPRIADNFQQTTDYAIRPLVELMEGRAAPSENNFLSDIVPPSPPRLRLYSDAPVFMRDTSGYVHSKDQRVYMRASTPERTALKLTKSEARIKELITRARHKFPSIYPGQDFDAQLWNVAHLRERQTSNQVVRFGFTTLASNVSNKLSTRSEDTLPPFFAEVVKSWMVISSDVTLATNTTRLYAARHFWHFLSVQRGADVASFRWLDLCESDMLEFEQFLLSGGASRKKPLGTGSVLQIINKTQLLIDFLAGHGICRNIDYVPQTQSPRLTSTRQLEGKRLAAELKLPAPGVLDALADIYHRLTTAPEGEVRDWLLIFISGVAILMLTGLRIGELVTLPYDCEVEEKRPKAAPSEPDSYWYGIRYWVEKRGRKTPRIKWISPTAEPVVRASIARIKRLTAAARERARVLESDPTRVPLPSEIANRDILSRPEVLAIIGQKKDCPVRVDPQGLVPQYGKGRDSYYYIKDLEAYLLSRRVKELYTIRHDDGTIQKLSESLFIIFAKQEKDERVTPCLLLVEPMKSSVFSRYLSSGDIFRDYGNEGRQKGLSTNPHCFRHWLMHVAYEGGMETHLILRYFAKLYVSSAVDYFHFSSNETDAYAPEELRAQRFYVPPGVSEGRAQKEHDG
jgi:integrase